MAATRRGRRLRKPNRINLYGLQPCKTPFELQQADTRSEAWASLVQTAKANGLHVYAELVSSKPSVVVMSGEGEIKLPLEKNMPTAVLSQHLST